jgi:hypothetical protein
VVAAAGAGRDDRGAVHGMGARVGGALPQRWHRSRGRGPHATGEVSSTDKLTRRLGTR